ncbi:MAG: efflux RND transporter periplasmic adaptor subunit [Phycisphaerae bacterium]|nr:efflux RND transporter periplasmic adaptor subunit [Phycisphaerae bacterium]
MHQNRPRHAGQHSSQAIALTLTLLCGTLLSGKPAAAQPTAGADNQPANTARVPVGTHNQADAAVPGFTAPAREATLAAVPAERIVRYLVQEGDSVHTDDLLVELDDGIQRQRTEIARLAAESTVTIDLARVRMEQAVAELERLDRLSSGAMTSVKELTDARFAADAAKLQYQVALLEHQQAARQLALQEQTLAQLQIRAPFDGCVVECLKEDGETVEEREGLLTIVQINPLTVTVDCPLHLARGVRVGDRFSVVPANPLWPARAGTVSFVNHVADPASQTVKVKLDVPNDDGEWIAGTRVAIELGQPLTAEQTPISDVTEETSQHVQGH